MVFACSDTLSISCHCFQCSNNRYRGQFFKGGWVPSEKRLFLPSERPENPCPHAENKPRSQWISQCCIILKRVVRRDTGRDYGIRRSHVS